MIGIHTLIRMPVHIQKRLKAAVISVSGLPKIKKPHNPAPLFFRRQRKLPLQPEIAIPTHKKIIKTELLPLPAALFLRHPLRRRTVIPYILRQHPAIIQTFRRLAVIVVIFSPCSRHGGKKARYFAARDNGGGLIPLLFFEIF